MAGPQQERGPQQGPSVWLLCVSTMDASWDPACFRPSPLLHRQGRMPFPEARARRHHHCHSCLQDRQLDARWSAGAGRTAAVSPRIKGTEPPDRFLCGQSCCPGPGSHATDFPSSTAPRQKRALGSLRVEGGHLEMDFCLRKTSQVHSLCCAYPDPALSFTNRGHGPVLYPSRTRVLAACWAAGQGNPRAELTLKAGSCGHLAPPPQPLPLPQATTLSPIRLCHWPWGSRGRRCP